MTNLITLTIPNDDHIALRAFGKALEEMALAHGAEPRKIAGELSYKLNIDTTEATAALERLNNATGELMQAAPGQLQAVRDLPEVDTTAQQVESLVPGNEYVPTVKPEPEITFTDTQGEQVVPATDSTGTPWDERIHSTSKALNADGMWRLRRKPKDMDEAEWAALVESVKNELMGVDAEDLKEFEESKQAILEPPALYPPENYVHMYRAADNIYALAKSDAEVAEFEADGYVRHTQEQYDEWEGVGDDFHTDAGVVTEQTVAGIPPIPVPPPVVVPPAPVDDAWTFPKLMTFLTERQGKIDVATVNMLLAQDGIASLPELNAHPDKIGPFVARVKAHLGE